MEGPRSIADDEQPIPITGKIHVIAGHSQTYPTEGRGEGGYLDRHGWVGDVDRNKQTVVILDVGMMVKYRQGRDGCVEVADLDRRGWVGDVDDVEPGVVAGSVGVVPGDGDFL